LLSIDGVWRDRKDASAVLPEGNRPVETIGERLKRLRLERGLSQRELAAPGVSYAYISRIEAGARRPSVKALRLLARKLGVSADYLETGSEIRDVEERELKLSDAELELRLADDPSEAERTVRDVLDEAMRAGDTIAATRAQIALGFAAQRSGDNRDATKHLEDALAIAPLFPSARPDVYITLGRAYAALGHAERAVELFQHCLDEVTERTPDDAVSQVRFAVYLSFALGDVGELEQANAVLVDALERAEELTDPLTRVRLYRSLGRLAALEQQPTTALSYFRRAIALLEATEDTLHLARAHLSCAWTLLSADRPRDAKPHLDLAARLFGPNPEPADLAYLRTEQARCELKLGNGEGAARLAREALEVLGDSDPHEQGGAWAVLGEALALQGEVPAAEEAFRRAVSLLEQHGQKRECAEALRAWGRLLREHGRETEALDVLERAAAMAVPAEAGRRVRA
jgi:tetratricopeptide (TPR) repeat protein